MLDSPAAVESGEPSLAVAPDGAVWLSWLEKRAAGGHAFRAARLADRRWAAAITIAAGDSFFVNWADFPTLLPLAGGRLAAHWPWKSGADVYSYDVRISQSADEGRTWSAPIVPHRDGTAAEHGFVSLVPRAQGIMAVWLDGRDYAYRKAQQAADSTKTHGSSHDEHGAAGDMALRAAFVAPDGSLRSPQDPEAPYEGDLLDPRVCDCCQTAAVTTRTGVLVAYRDRGENEQRDISLVRMDEPSAGGWTQRGAARAWSAPYPLHEDGWNIDGCPVNGPAMDARADRVVVAWYTAARDTERVRVAFSDDGGQTFGAPIRVDEGSPLGRVDVVLLDDGNALVTWLENAPEKQASIRLRRVSRAGVATTAMTVANTSAARASGFPRMVRSGDRLVFAWTDPGKPARVRTAIATLK